MSADYLKAEGWDTVMEGVHLYRLHPGALRQGVYPYVRPAGFTDRYEFFFCCSGSFSLTRRGNPELEVGEQEIFCFTDTADVRSVEVTEGLSGFCLSVSRPAAGPALEEMYRLLGCGDISDSRLEELMTRHGGCMRIRNTSWNEAAFAVLRSLPGQEQGRYCVMKILELIYLLCAQHALLEAGPDHVPVMGYSAHTIRRVGAYMEGHLDEKMTIQELSFRFHMSSTALKNGFRTLYGQPIHTWLQEKRIQLSAEMLRFSDSTVLQIAQSVGYEGVSQFNVIFKRRFGMTPSEYRKMSETIES